MTQARHITLAAVALCAAPAVAQDDPTGPRGAFELEYLRSGDRSDLVLNGDLGLSHRGAGAGAVGLGFDLGLTSAYNLSEGEDATRFIAAAVLSFGFGELAVGLPESIGEVLVNRPSFAGNGQVDDALDGLMPPVTGTIARNRDAQAYGLRFSAEAGALRYGVSALKVQDLSGVVVEAAGAYALGQGTVEGMLEFGSDSGRTGGTLGLTQSFGQVDLGAYMGWQRAVARADSVQASVDYHLSDSLTVGGDIGRVKQAGVTSNLVGASMEYRFGSGAYGQLGITDSNRSPVLYDLSVGIRF
ncbi:MAG: hypothetical protein RIR62_1937 [Pseudomonadota bacterium]